MCVGVVAVIIVHEHSAFPYMVFSAVKCPPIPVWYGFVPNTTNRRYLTTVNATCEANHALKSGAVSMVSVCKEHGGWTPPFEVCHGKLQVNSYTYDLFAYEEI